MFEGYFKPNPGSNIIRLLSTPWQYNYHPRAKRLVPSSTSPRETAVKCMIDPCCPLCQKQLSIRRGWLLPLSYQDRLLLWDLNRREFTKLRQLVSHPMWRHFSSYDIDVVLDELHVCHYIPVVSTDSATQTLAPEDQEILHQLCQPESFELKDIVLLERPDLEIQDDLQSYDN